MGKMKCLFLTACLLILAPYNVMAQVLQDPLQIVSSKKSARSSIDLKQLYLTRNMGDSAWSPDGQTIAFVANLSGRNNIWLVSPSNTWPRQLTFNEERQATPAWSPNGKYVAFSQDRKADEEWDIYIVSIENGSVENLTNSSDIAEETPAWSPDSKSLAYTVKARDSATYEIDILEIAAHKTTHLISKTSSELVNFNPQWSPKGRYIAYTQGDYTGTINSNIYVADLQTGEKRLLTEHLGNRTYLVCDWSPDEKTLLITSNAKNGYNNAALIEVETGKITWLSEQNWEVTAGYFSPDGSQVSWTINEDGNVNIYLQDIKSKLSRRLLLPLGVNTLGGTRNPGSSQSAFSKDGRFLLFYHDGPEAPNDLWIYDLKTDTPLQITQSLAAGIHSDDMVKPFLIHYPSRDEKWQISAFVYVPNNIERNKRNPAIVYVHGGPNSQSTNSFSRTLQYLINHGYIVIAPNYRGSTGYGQRFHDANRMDLGGGDLEDVLSAADWIEKTGYVDQKKLVLFGGSYGGYLTMMGLVKAPERWVAGAALFPFVNWFTFAKGTDPAIWEYFSTKMGDSTHNQQLWVDRSPINFLDRVKSPIFLLAGGQDPRAPKAETLQVIKALRKLRGVVDWRVYEDEGHGFARVENQIDGYSRLIQFLQKYAPAEGSLSLERK
jgi:dipeptidyl aminopeptidase/acylaminoacyl peptidase